MASRLKAIETRYAGQRFRSRLEARFARFFDALNISWEYEPEGFNLGDGLLYLPDFWLPKQEYWIEIKGKPPTALEKEKASRLAVQSGYPIYIFFGACQPGTIERLAEGGTRFEGWAWYCWPDGEQDGGMDWLDCGSCGFPVIGYWGQGCTRCHFSTDDSPRVRAAYAVARSARFEFGEHG